MKAVCVLHSCLCTTSFRGSVVQFGDRTREGTAAFKIEREKRITDFNITAFLVDLELSTVSKGTASFKIEREKKIADFNILAFLVDLELSTVSSVSSK